MPYGNLAEQAVQRFAALEDLDKHKCTIEEREEYEPHVRAGSVVYAGVDYASIAEQAAKEADVIIWDGGNNDTPFYKSDLEIVVTDPHRPGHELAYYPGEENLRRADVVLINKVNTASAEDVHKVRANIESTNPSATVIEGDSLVTVPDPAAIRGKRVLVIEDGPTLTHGEMTFGAGVVAARENGASELADPRPYATGSIRETFEKYSHLRDILPAMGYGDVQRRELEETINSVPCDLILVATPIDLASIIRIDKPSLRVSYELKERSEPSFDAVLSEFVRTKLPSSS
jgi:predicted GTPase